MSERQQYIIGRVGSGAGSAISLADIVKILEADSQAEVMEIQGPPNDPSLLVASLTPERAQQLQEQYQGKLIVELDAPLKPFLG